jgi:hypothetical protein
MRTNELGEDVIFFESTAAARSLMNPWTRMASTYDCIQVILSQEHLIVKPRPMLGWIIRALLLDLDHVIPTNQITAVEPVGKFLSYGKIQVAFSTESQGRRDLVLYLRGSGEFLDRLKR